MIERVCKSIGKGQPIFGKIPYRIGENKKLYANIEKITNVLGWKTKINIEEGLDKTIESFRT